MGVLRGRTPDTTVELNMLHKVWRVGGWVSASVLVLGVHDKKL